MLPAEEVSRCIEQNHQFWCMREALCVKGDVAIVTLHGTLLQQRTISADPSIWRVARAALSWELRTAIDLARLRRDQGCIAEVRELLASVYGRIPGGHGTADPQTAKRLLDELTEVTDG